MSEEFSAEPVPVKADSNVDVSTVFEKEITSNPEEIVKTTQAIRVGFLKQMTDHGRKLPSCEDDVKLTLQLMRDMDNTAQTASKLAIEDRAAGSAEEVARLSLAFAAQLKNVSSGQVRINKLEDDIVLPEFEFDKAELEQGEAPLEQDTYIGDRS